MKSEDAQKIIDFHIDSTNNTITRQGYLDTLKLKKLLLKETEKLHTLKKMLTGDMPFDLDIASNILKSSNYLYIHFPDYTDFSTLKIQDISFLKRIRIELEFFLKIIN